MQRKMIIFEWTNPLFEMVVERHDGSVPPKIERLPREVLIDLGKFSCAATLFCRKGSVSALLLPATGAIALGFLVGISIPAVGADTSTLKPTAYQQWTSH
jgi:hypothetical protein